MSPLEEKPKVKSSEAPWGFYSNNNYMYLFLYKLDQITSAVCLFTEIPSRLFVPLMKAGYFSLIWRHMSTLHVTNWKGNL